MNTPPSAVEGRRDHAERVFEEALTVSYGDRARFVGDACGDDAALAAELRSLLEHAEAGERFFGRLAGAMLQSPIGVVSTVCGRYEVIGLIGAGGMGSVYRAHDTRLDRDVALKFLPPHLSVAPGAEDQLLLEARAAAGLEHINICTVYEVGETDEGWPFIAMALYNGESLKERLSRGPLPLTEAIDIACHIARGLGAAHARGIVHRDVKPGNVMLTTDGTAKLLDFGLATMPNSCVATGMTPGTVPYMSPEQTRGESLGRESDLWSLGVVLYEMLSGVRPFQGQSSREIVDAIRHSTFAPLSSIASSASTSLDRIVERLLQKEPSRRCNSTDALLADLAHERPSAASRTTRRLALGGHRRWIATLIVVLIAGMSAPTAWRRIRHASYRTEVSAATVSTSTRRTLALLPFDNADLNPDAKYLTEGLTEELTRALSGLPSVRVVSRASASRVTSVGRNVQEIGRALNVNAVLTGKLQNSNGRLRVTARLVDVADGSELWSKTYEHRSAELLMLPRELAVQIANALAVELSPVERGRIGRPGTRSDVALASFLKGRYFANQRNAAAYRLAIGYFTEAIAADSQYGAPWAGLAAVYSQQGMSGQLSPQEAQRLTQAAALRAIRLDDASAEVHAILGVYLHCYAWSSKDAESEFRRAIELDPGYALAHFYYSTMLRSVHRFDEAIAQLTTAIELDPLVPAFSETLGFTLLAAGRMDEALPRVRTALELDSTYWRAHAVLGNYFELTHRYEDAIREYERANQLAGPTAHRTTADLARLAALTGRKDEAARLLAILQSRATRTAIYEPAVATAYHALGDDASAYDWLEHAYRQRQPELRFLIGDLRFRPMSGDPRFIGLLGRLRLPR